MTYANDCIQIRDRDKRRGLKRIDRHTDGELDEAIERAVRKHGQDFWILLHGIDAYMERRKRRDERRDERNEECLQMPPLDEDVMWGKS